MADHILTTHAGSLPRPDDLIELYRRDAPAEELAPRLRSAVAEIVKSQRDTGIDIVDDGEYGKAARGPIDYGPWQSYAFARLQGWEAFDPDSPKAPTSPSGERLRGMGTRRDWQRFRDFYDEYTQTARFSGLSGQPFFTGPIKYRGQEAVAADIANLKAALEKTPATDAFMCAVAPGSFARGRNAYYKTDEEYLLALSEALREEYQAIVGAGFVLQVDDPGLPDSWDMFDPAPSLDEYKKYASICIEALNHALAGLPQERVRYHICWGSWHGPHTTDIPLRDVVDLVLKVQAGAYSIEAANVRHEHEWRVWESVRLPEGKALIPGVVSHATNLVEHAELVRDRIVRFAGLVGRDNVIAGTDCGLGGRIHPQIAWAKLESLVEGAQLASQELWG